LPPVVNNGYPVQSWPDDGVDQARQQISQQLQGVKQQLAMNADPRQRFQLQCQEEALSVQYRTVGTPYQAQGQQIADQMNATGQQALSAYTPQALAQLGIQNDQLRIAGHMIGRPPNLQAQTVNNQLNCLQRELQAGAGNSQMGMFGIQLRRDAAEVRMKMLDRPADPNGLAIAGQLDTLGTQVVYQTNPSTVLAMEAQAVALQLQAHFVGHPPDARVAPLVNQLNWLSQQAQTTNPAYLPQLQAQLAQLNQQAAQIR
jgi:hypothetical protein